VSSGLLMAAILSSLSSSSWLKNALLKTGYDPYPTSNTMDKASVPDVNVALEPILRLQQKVGLPRNLDA
jgi:hypothetical protein